MARVRFLGQNHLCHLFIKDIQKISDPPHSLEKSIEAIIYQIYKKYLIHPFVFSKLSREEMLIELVYFSFRWYYS